MPDAIDLIVRSLKIGHPLSGAMSVVGRELPVPISTEFASAFEQVTYGQEIPTAFANMAERVPLQDLGYLSMAIQIQQESGGNLVESLSEIEHRDPRPLPDVPQGQGPDRGGPAVRPGCSRSSRSRSSS